MELRVLKYFLTVADEGNITRAADILHVTQPTLSRQLIELEDELGTALLIRGKRSVTLTDEGFLFKQQAEMIVELSDKLEHTFKDTIRIGASEAVGCRALALYMKEFREKYPDVQFDLYNGMADNIKERLERGLLDLGLVLEPIDTAKFEYVRLPQKETWGLLLRKDHELAEKETLTVEEIRQYPLIMPGRENAKEERECKRGSSSLDAVRGKTSGHPGFLQSSFQRCIAGRGRDGLRSLSGRRIVHTCGSQSLFSPDSAGAHNKECDPVEKESSIFSGGVPFRTDNPRILKMVMTSAKTPVPWLFLFHRYTKNVWFFIADRY